MSAGRRWPGPVRAGGRADMSMFEVAACLITLAAILSYLNYTWLQFPRAIGLMALSLAGSLLSDGVAVVVCLGLLEIASGASGFDPPRLAELFAWETVGGAAMGFVLGWLTYRMLRSVDNYQVEVLLSLALVASGYALVN